MTWALRTVVAAFSIVSGALHYVIWSSYGYRGAPVREMFIAQAVVAVVAGLLALAPNRWAAVPAAAVAAASLVAFVLSRTVGVPTLHGSFSESGLNPTSAKAVGISATLVILVVEAGAVLAGLLLVLRRGRAAQSG